MYDLYDFLAFIANKYKSVAQTYYKRCSLNKYVQNIGT